MGLLLFYIGCICLAIWGYSADKQKKEREKQKEAEYAATAERYALLQRLYFLRSRYIYGGYAGDLDRLPIHELRRLVEISNELFASRQKSCQDSMRKNIDIQLRGTFSGITPNNKQQVKSIAKKIDWQQIKEYLDRNGVTHLYHFTDQANIASIKKSGGLYSWKYCLENDIDIPKAGGDSLSRNLDRRYGLEDYVRLSFCCDHPMAHRLKQKGGDLVLLRIKIDVAWFDGTLFSDMNATDSSHSHGATLADLEKVDISATKERYVSSTSSSFKKHQAEVLVRRFIPLEYIENIDNPIQL